MTSTPSPQPRAPSLAAPQLVLVRPMRVDYSANVDKVGNLIQSWTVTASSLLAARDTLCSQREAAEEKATRIPSPRKMAPEERSYWIEVMLVGFAFENLLKALWIARGNQLYSGGRLQKLGRAKSHDLLGIAETVGFDIEGSERKDVAMLSEIMTGIGRYPLALQPKAIEAWGGDSDLRVQRLILRLRKAIRDAAKA